MRKIVIFAALLLAAGEKPPFILVGHSFGGKPIRIYTSRNPNEVWGLILADTKLEFGLIDGRLVVIDEMMTPDSSRYWSADDHVVGTSPPSFDKQYVRDHYLSIGWNQQPPVPHIPASVIAGTRARYVEAYEQVSGNSFDTWYGDDE